MSLSMFFSPFALYLHQHNGYVVRRTTVLGNFQQVLADIQKRDYQDSHRPIAPLKQAKDAVLLDTSELDIEGVIAAMKKIVGEKISL